MAGSKSFHDLVEALNRKRKTQEDPDRFNGKPDDDEVDFYGHQRADGEQQFRAAHKTQTHDEPEANGNAAATTPQSQKQGASLGRSGEDSRPRQGSSKVPAGNPEGKKSISAFTAQTPLRRGDADNVGDMQPVVLSPSAVNPKQKGFTGIAPEYAKVNTPTGDRDILRKSPSATKSKAPGARKAYSQFKEELETPPAPTAISAFDVLFNNPNQIRSGLFESGESCVIDSQLDQILGEAYDLLDENNKQNFEKLVNESIDSFTSLVQFIVSEMESE
jgi:hypothetical protein